MSLGLSYIIFVIVITLIYQIGHVRSLESPKCYSVHEKEGECVNFDMCPPLKELLKSGSLTIDKLRILQRLTCGFNRDEPKICCPLTEIVRELADIPGFQTNSQDKLKPEQGHPVPRPTPNPPQRSTTPSVLETNNRIQGPIGLTYRAHPNFHLLPDDVKDCSNPVNSDRIVGGKEAALASFPWMARIGYRNEQTQEIEFYCGGTIINKRYILTAAHCTEEIDEGYTPATVRVGEHDTTTEEDCSPYLGCARYADYQIEKLIPHPDYNTDDKANDIELIRVDKDISFESFAVRPVCLPFPKEYGINDVWQKEFAGDKKHKGWVTGWGRTRWNSAEGSNTLQEIQLPLITNEECQFNYSMRVRISEKQMCAGGLKHKDSCGGDSGGPLFVPIPVKGEGKFFQLGVVSFGPVQCGVAGLPGVYSRISAYLNWILDNIRP